MRIPRDLYEQIVEHAREEAPGECCGMVAVRDGDALALHRARNATERGQRHLRFEIDSREQLAIHNAIEDEGLDLGAIYHSHTRTEPYPSQTDVTYASLWPGVVWVIVGLASDEPDVKAWRIDEGLVSEVELVVE